MTQRTRNQTRNPTNHHTFVPINSSDFITTDYNNSRLCFSNFRPLTCFQSDGTRCCTYTIEPPEDEHNYARNM